MEPAIQRRAVSTPSLLTISVVPQSPLVSMLVTAEAAERNQTSHSIFLRTAKLYKTQQVAPIRLTADFSPPDT